jgi:hypothetical protein
MKGVVNDTASRGFCGPTVIAAITRQPLSVVLTAARRATYPDWDSMTRRPPIKGMSTGQVRRTLNLLGYDMRQCSTFDLKPTKGWGVAGRPSLAKWFKTRTEAERKNLVIVNVTNHWVLVKGNKFLDTMTGGRPVRIGLAPGRRKRVEKTFIVTKLKSLWKVEIEALESRALLAEQSYRRRRNSIDTSARREIVKLGGKPSVYRDGGLSYLKVAFDPPVNDVKEVETMHYDWHTSLDRVKSALADPDPFRDQDDRQSVYYSE